MMRQVLSAALTRAAARNWSAATWHVLRNCRPGSPPRSAPWSADEALAFLRAAKTDPLYPAFVFLLLYGMRRGEVLGLRWHRHRPGRRHVPHPPAAPASQRRPASARLRPAQATGTCRSRPPRVALLPPAAASGRPEAFGRAWQDTGLVFTTRSGRPIEPRNLVRSFRRICDHNKHPCDQGPPPPAHDCVAVEEAARPAPRRSDDLRPRALLHHDADLHACGRGRPERGHHRAQRPAHVGD